MYADPVNGNSMDVFKNKIDRVGPIKITNCWTLDSQ